MVSCSREATARDKTACPQEGTVPGLLPAEGGYFKIAVAVSSPSQRSAPAGGPGQQTRTHKQLCAGAISTGPKLPGPASSGVAYPNSGNLQQLFASRQPTSTELGPIWCACVWNFVSKTAYTRCLARVSGWSTASTWSGSAARIGDEIPGYTEKGQNGGSPRASRRGNLWRTTHRFLHRLYTHSYPQPVRALSQLRVAVLRRCGRALPAFSSGHWTRCVLCSRRAPAGKSSAPEASRPIPLNCHGN